VIALELVSLPAFALVGLKRGDRRSAEAALKFFLVSVVSTAVMLYGISLVYGVTGTMHIWGIRVALDVGAEPRTVLAIGVVLTLVGLLFKVAAVPFHGWVPDTYVGAPPAVAAYLSVVSKAAGLVGLLVVLSQGVGEYGEVWGPVLAVVAALTMTVGNVLAMRQRHAVRLLAWSSVAQSGCMLAPLAVIADTRQGVSASAVEAVFAYLLIYSVVNLGAFAVVAMMTRHRPAGAIADYQGLVRREPWAGIGLAFALLCLAGLPPGVIGLFAKVVVFESVVDGGLGWLAVVMAVNVALGLAYYLRWMVVVLGPVGDDAASPDVHPAVGTAIGSTLVAAVALSVAPSVVLQLLG
jgi:NADH-quinone oxidoreductase subunit N